ncbi:hypothetical protein LTR35_009470 [Friedmanniomyces endolithicus]|uniref:Uncharacterized protein n=1 Tax=Friedmanniomyces endolithicus TaxID=329885 RepID=A0AAN6FFY9_9PEZI|nr:hypothetical protein LTR35_009470 [Friedmanniomyces endolithicus]KAK0290811.1 hypothetical protein LTS00_008588 [Friedmanniomyces endolithicus]KAK0317048.1 hypothetical protein LTR82_011917 [Friedmanniomyces endolithicus]KAK0997904.1 hypothetical protein LTR54_009702 [Friedmanniomyces endolithicus]
MLSRSSSDIERVFREIGQGRAPVLLSVPTASKPLRTWSTAEDLGQDREVPQSDGIESVGERGRPDVDDDEDDDDDDGGVLLPPDVAAVSTASEEVLSAERPRSSKPSERRARHRLPSSDEDEEDEIRASPVGGRPPKKRAQLSRSVKKQVRYSLLHGDNDDDPSYVDEDDGDQASSRFDLEPPLSKKRARQSRSPAKRPSSGRPNDDEDHDDHDDHDDDEDHEDGEDSDRALKKARFDQRLPALSKPSKNKRKRRTASQRLAGAQESDGEKNEDAGKPNGWWARAPDGAFASLGLYSKKVHKAIPGRDHTPDAFWNTSIGVAGAGFRGTPAEYSQSVERFKTNFCYTVQVNIDQAKAVRLADLEESPMARHCPQIWGVLIKMNKEEIWSIVDAAVTAERQAVLGIGVLSAELVAQLPRATNAELHGPLVYLSHVTRPEVTGAYTGSSYDSHGGGYRMMVYERAVQLQKEQKLVQKKSLTSNHLDSALHADAEVNLRVLMSFSSSVSSALIVLCESLMTDFLQTLGSEPALTRSKTGIPSNSPEMTALCREACAPGRLVVEHVGLNRTSPGRQGSGSPELGGSIWNWDKIADVDLTPEAVAASEERRRAKQKAQDGPCGLCRVDMKGSLPFVCGTPPRVKFIITRDYVDYNCYRWLFNRTDEYLESIRQLGELGFAQLEFDRLDLNWTERILAQGGCAICQTPATDASDFSGGERGLNSPLQYVEELRGQAICEACFCSYKKKAIGLDNEEAERKWMEDRPVRKFFNKNAGNITPLEYFYEHGCEVCDIRSPAFSSGSGPSWSVIRHLPGYGGGVMCSACKRAHSHRKPDTAEAEQDFITFRKVYVEFGRGEVMKRGMVRDLRAR